ncbi:MAG TPA: 6-phosphogluconolactonase [Candidatus Saccharimonadales bacterium]|nr:6-phosphogluconolactonase [Candidatus Saccharimonadales bacterium]
MRYIRTSGWEDGIADLTQRLVHELAAEKCVVWLICGGSNIPASVQVMRTIPKRLRDHLIILLIDERYGPVGHPDSNAAQLEQAGFRPTEAHWLPILHPNTSLPVTVKQYEKVVAKTLAQADCIIGQLGIGEDGHLAGIMPDSPAAQETSRLVYGYQATDFERITLTFPALRQIDVAYAFAFGPAKRAALEHLQRRRPANKQPSQILKQLPEAYVYNDQIGEIL